MSDLFQGYSGVLLILMWGLFGLITYFFIKLYVKKFVKVDEWHFFDYGIAALMGPFILLCVPLLAFRGAFFDVGAIPQASWWPTVLLFSWCAKT